MDNSHISALYLSHCLFLTLYIIYNILDGLFSNANTHLYAVFHIYVYLFYVPLFIYWLYDTIICIHIRKKKIHILI